MKPSVRELSAVAAALVPLVVMSSIPGCAPPPRLEYPGHRSFTTVNVSSLRVGMEPSAIKQVFGDPDAEYEMEFGGDVEEAWIGRVWIYFTELDRSLRHALRYKKSVLVFYPPGPNMKLNHWVVEE